MSEKIIYGCGQVGGDCPVGARDKENFCHHPKYCNHKTEFGTIRPKYETNHIRFGTKNDKKEKKILL